MDQWSKPHLIIKLDSDTMQYRELRSHRGSRLVSEFVLRFLYDTFKTGAIVLQSSSSSSSSPTATSSDNETRERQDRIESDTSPVLVSTVVDDRTGQAVIF